MPRREQSGPLATSPESDVDMSSEPSKKEKIRVQFEFAPEALARLDALKEVTEAPTRAELVRSALRFYEWLVNEAQRGSTIMTYDREGKLASQFPADFLMR